MSFVMDLTRVAPKMTGRGRNDGRFMIPLLTIDFEASCLPRDGRSFPIEVGVADLSGWSRSWLIRPAPAWDGWGWTSEAQALHGLSCSTLFREGRPAAEIMAELNDTVNGRRVVADHHLDRVWLDTLSAAAGIASSFHVGHISELLDVWCPAAADIRLAVATANRRTPCRHRAAADATWLATVARSLAITEAERPPSPWGDRPADDTDIARAAA